jgi:hypothetical protein
MLTCGCLFDEDGSDEEELPDDIFVDANGCPTERVTLGGQEVIIHYDDDLPATDLTIHRGIPCTTPLRTVIDIAPEVERAHLQEIVSDCLARGLFTVAEARARIAEPDMARRPGAQLLRDVLPG